MAERLGENPSEYRERADDVAWKLNLLLWLDRPWDGHAFGKQLEHLKEMRLEWFLLYQNTATLTEKPHYLPWVGFPRVRQRLRRLRQHARHPDRRGGRSEKRSYFGLRPRLRC